VYDLIEDEVMSLMREELIDSGALGEMSYPIYDKYLTLSELQELLRFYKTAIGQKLISVMPKITREAMQAGEAWGQSMAPVIYERLMIRFETENIQFE